MRLVKYIGRIAEWLNIKDKLILLYEKGYDSVKTINKLLILALGPTASVLAWEFSVRGYQAVDIGNIDKEYEWFQLGATSKKRNPLKFSMDVKDGINVQECTDNDYLKDIICKIGC